MESLRPRRITEYVEVCWRRKRLIILMAAVMLIATFLVIRRLPNLYESRALVVITNQANDDRSAQGVQFATLMQQLTSRANLATLVRKYNLYRPALDLDTAIEKLRKDLKPEIKMRNYYPDAPEAISVSYRYSDPVITARVVGDVVTFFEDANTTLRQQAATDAGRLTLKISEVESRLHELAPQRDLALLRFDANRSGNDSLAIRTQRMTTASSVESLSDKEYALEQQIDQQKRLIAEQEKLVQQSITSGATGNPRNDSAYGVLLAKKADLDAQIKDLSTQFTEKHPKMIQVNTQLTEINRQIARFEASPAGDPKAAPMTPEARELRDMRRELSRLETELTITQRDLQRKTQALNNMPDVEASKTAPDGNSMDATTEARSEYDRLISRYNWLLDKQDALQKLAGSAASGGSGGSGASLFQVVDLPVTPQLPVAPNRQLLKLLAIGIALVFGLLFAFAFELPRMFFINDDRDVEYYLGAPVLALIPETTTPIERSRARRLRWARGFGVLLIAAALVPVLIALLNRTQIFHILASK